MMIETKLDVLIIMLQEGKYQLNYTMTEEMCQQEGKNYLGSNLKRPNRLWLDFLQRVWKQDLQTVIDSNIVCFSMWTTLYTLHGFRSQKVGK